MSTENVTVDIVHDIHTRLDDITEDFDDGGGRLNGKVIARLSTNGPKATGQTDALGRQIFRAEDGTESVIDNMGKFTYRRPVPDNDNVPTGANNTGKGVKGDPCGCFIAGTDVLTPSGLVDIETIDIGDLVMAWREDGTGYGAYPVSALIRPPSRVIWQLTLLDAQGNIETFETLKA